MAPEMVKCVACNGSGTLVYRADTLRFVGSGPLPDDARGLTENTCTYCKGEAQRSAVSLDEKGRCCGRRPMVYKLPRHRLFCSRCDSEFDPTTGRQQSNWAWTVEQANG